MTIALWVLAVLLIVAGVVGTVLPALPGVILVFAGVALGAWIDGFARISGWTVGVLGVLTLIAWLIDFVAGYYGAKRVGASAQALAGAAIGTVAGVFTGLVGLVFMPLAGAAIGSSSPGGTRCAPAGSGSRPGSAWPWAPPPRSRSCS